MSTRCHVCGLDQGEAPWGDDGRSQTFAICNCCGCEFGYQDSRASGVLRHRQKWIEAGFPWSEPKAKPDGWSPEEQLRQVPRELPAGIDRDVEIG